MKSQKIDLKKIADTLRDHCPFILFAMLKGLDEEGQPKCLENLELSVFIDASTGTWYALEQILPVIATAVPGVCIDVTMLNRVDALTRFRAIHGFCLFIQEDYEPNFRKFVQRANLDYRILRARSRRMGIIDND